MTREMRRREGLSFKFYYVRMTDGSPRIMIVTDRTIQHYRQNRKTKWLRRNESK